MRNVLHPALRNHLTSVDTDTEAAMSLESLTSGDESVFGNDTIMERERSDSHLCYSRSQRRVGRRCSINISCSPEERSQRERRAYERCCKRPHTLILADSWAGHSGADNSDRMRALGARLLQIPKKTTSQIQPLDVTMFR